MKAALALVASSAAVAAMAGVTVNGAGASFPAPLYGKWTYTYNQASGNTFNYQSVGSGAGIAQIKAKTVDFGASDDPLEPETLDEAGLMQFPMVMGGVVPIVNLPGIKAGQLKLTGPVLADIFLGKIKKWNDEAIAGINPDVKLPPLPITVVHRSDGSGTTWIFTNYLAKVSEDWKNGPGNSKDVKWPVGIGGQKNPGVANGVQKTIGAIGYVEYAYAVEAKLPYASLKNKDGNFVEPSAETFMASAAGADWANAKNFYMVLTEQPGAKSWPISGATYILLYKEQPDAAKAKEMLKFFSWCLDDGDKTAVELHYIPMPDGVVKLIKNAWKTQIKSSGKPVFE
jgi:phosphate transport system substrate-binding protein